MSIMPGLLLLALAVPVGAAAQPAASADNAAAQQIRVEYYYRIKWGSLDEFKRLYDLNHAPILQEMQKSGHIVSIRSDEPFNHMAGGERWDYRVTITFRDAASAMFSDKGFQAAWQQAQSRLYPDKEKFASEEARRFSLVEEHWDVVLW